jgi:hypothetical protein
VESQYGIALHRESRAFDLSQKLFADVHLSECVSDVVALHKQSDAPLDAVASVFVQSSIFVHEAAPDLAVSQ